MKTKEKTTWRELTTEEWERIAPLITAPRRQGKRKKVTDRQMVDALLYRKHTSVPWSKIPGLEDAHMAVVKRYTRWRDDGILQRIYAELEQMGLMPAEGVFEEGNVASTKECKTVEQPLEWWELTDEQWKGLLTFLPEEDLTSKNGRYRTNRQVLNALLYREYTNVPWRELPEEFGPWRTIYARYIKWKEDGTFDRLFFEMKRSGVLCEEKYVQTQWGATESEEGRDWWELTEEQWQRVLPLFSKEAFDKRGKKGKSNRQMLNAILCKYHTRIVWLDLPEKYGSWRTVIDRYRKWREDGTMQCVFDELGLPWNLTKKALEEKTWNQTEKERLPLEWWELTDEQWGWVEDLLPQDQTRAGSKCETTRWILNVLLYREYTNTAWVDLPKGLVSWRTIYDRYAKWKETGALQRVFAELERRGVMTRENYLRGDKRELDEQPLEWWEVTDEQWSRIQVFFGRERENKRGRKAKNNRQVLNAILCRYYTGAAWLELPKKYGPCRTIIDRYQMWRDNGILDRVFGELNK